MFFYYLFFGFAPSFPFIYFCSVSLLGKGHLLEFKVFLTRWGSIDHDGHPTGHVMGEFTFFTFFYSTLLALAFVMVSLHADRRPITVLLGYLFELFLFGLFLGWFSELLLVYSTQ